MTDTGEKTSTSDPEKKAQRSEEETTTVRVCLFYDGTLNNRRNIQARKSNEQAFKKHGGDDTSYTNEESNVSKLEPFIEKDPDHDYVLTVYTEGPGSENLESDHAIGYALGTSGPFRDTGVPQKVNKGLNELITKFQSSAGVPKNKCITKLDVDVFGFSRGAAGARFAIHKIMSTRSIGRRAAMWLAKRLRFRGYNIEDAAVKINFVGLFDTVASYGMNHKNDTRELKLDSISTYKANKVVHLVAADEHRNNFSLTNINSVGGSGKTVYLPGVHSDIGGGYVNGKKEELYLRSSYALGELRNDRNQLIRDGWYTEAQIWIKEFRAPPPTLGAGGFGAMPALPPPHQLRAKRDSISNKYDRIPLHIMADFAKEAGITIHPDFTSFHTYSRQGLLSSAANYLKQYAKGSSSPNDWKNPQKQPWLRELRNKYLHFSSHLATSAAVLTPHKPNLVNGQRVRDVHYG